MVPALPWPAEPPLAGPRPLTLRAACLSLAWKHTVHSMTVFSTWRTRLSLGFTRKKRPTTDTLSCTRLAAPPAAGAADSGHRSTVSTRSGLIVLCAAVHSELVSSHDTVTVHQALRGHTPIRPSVCGTLCALRIYAMVHILHTVRRHVLCK